MPRYDSPPIDFDDAARAIWKAAQSQLRQQGTWRKTDGPLLQAYVRSVRLAQRAREAAEQYPLQRSSTGGNLIGYVELKVADGAESAALKYATALLLTAESRKRHGITIPSGAISELEALIG